MSDVSLHVVYLEVRDGLATHGYTSLHRTPEGAAQRLYDKAREWHIDLENDPDVVSSIFYLPLED